MKITARRVRLSDGSESSAFVLPQAEPDGTYSGQTAATYVLCVRADAAPRARGGGRRYLRALARASAVTTRPSGSVAASTTSEW